MAANSHPSDSATAAGCSTFERLADLLLGVGQYPPAISRAEVQDMSQECTIRQLNGLIHDLSREAGRIGEESRYFYKIAEFLADEVRRRAEQLETQTALPVPIP